MLPMKIQDSVQYLKGVGPKKKAELARLGIATVYDLLTYFPRTYEDQSVLTRIADLQPGTVATVAGTIVNLQEQTGRRGLTILTAYLNDGTGILQVTWFNQKYLKKTLKAGRRVFVSGKAAYAYGGRGQFAMSQLRSFQVLEPGEQAQGLCGILPVYAATEHLNQKFFRTLIAEALEAAGDLPELIPARILAAHHLMGRREALHAVHFPKDGAELKRARYRLAFSELYLIQCGLLLLKKRHPPSAKRQTRQGCSCGTALYADARPAAGVAGDLPRHGADGADAPPRAGRRRLGQDGHRHARARQDRREWPAGGHDGADGDPRRPAL